MNSPADTNQPHPKLPTHRDLCPPDMCPHLVFKQVLIHGLDEEIYDDREEPGDGYYWCELSFCEIGPDDELASPKACTRERSCHPEN